MARFAHAMLPGHIKALWDIATCRSGVKGGRLVKCNKCGHMKYVYHSCCNRSCPQCHLAKSHTWLEKRKQELLEVPYFHLVFTLPRQLRPIVRSNQKVMYTILFKAAVYALKKLTADKRYLGGQIGILVVLHTWGRALGFHPHLHCLVPGVGLSKDKQHIYLARHNYLVPVKALSKIFRAKFLQLAREELPQKVFDDKCLTNTPKKWVVYSKPTLSHTEKVLEYLARYLHRTAITNSRIVEINPHEETVTFKYKPVGAKDWKCVPLKALEFMRRFLQHGLPKGFHKVRYYGFLSPTNQDWLKRIQTLLLLLNKKTQVQIQVQEKERNQPESSDNSGDSYKTNKNKYKICPICMTGYMVEVMRLDAQSIPYKQRPPPWLTHHAKTIY
ncbi:MAG: transposase [Desulfobacteraceae bacterium]|nr:transposase [Desulfobacteraceae bacterium]